MSEIIPNSFQTPNLYIDRLFPLITDQEKAVLVYAVRRIFGWNKRSDRISISDFSAGTGSGRSSVLRSTSSLVSFGVLVVLAENDGRNEGRLYGLELDEKRIDWKGLADRKKKEGEADSERMKTAKKKAIKERSSGLTAGGQADRPLSPQKADSVNIKNAPSMVSFKHKVLKSENEESSRSRSAPRIHQNPQFSKGASSLYPSSPAQFHFFARLGNNFHAKGRNRPERFPTLEAKAEFELEEKRLGDKEIDRALAAGLGKGILSVTHLLQFIQAWGKSGGKVKTSIPSRFQAIARSMRSADEELALPAPKEEDGIEG